MKTGGAIPGAHSSGATHDAAAAAVRLVRELLDAPTDRRAGGGGADAVPGGKPGPGTDGSRRAGEPAAEPASWTEAAGVLAALNLDEHCIAAGLAGLLVEGGRVGLDAVRKHLGGGVAQLVEGLLRFDELRSFPSEDPAVPAGRDAGADRARRAERLRRLLLAVVDDVRVLLVQLALTLHRLRTARERPGPERERLARESLDIYAPLASRLGVWQYKWEIEDLAFRESDPETYRGIARQLAERRVDRERFVEEAVCRVGAQLRRAGIGAEVTGRAKHIHSIWRKMQRKSLDVEQAGIEKLFDLRAIRVLVDTEAECYTALGAVHGLWTHVPREFDDYVANPKPNGYRSLHTAVMGPGGRTLEVQIRTREMHAQAELGVAAHWRYKEGVQGKEPGLDTRIAWLRQLLETGEDAGEPGSLLDSLGRELDAERVYAFTPRGDVVDLPAGSTPLDFAYQIHTEVGHRCRGAKVDGRIVPLTYTVRSGDRIEVLTARQPRPSRDWLNPNLGYLGSARSRAKVRHWFKHQDRERNVADGQEIWERELKRLGGRGPAPRGAGGAVQRIAVRGRPRRAGAWRRERAPARGGASAVSARAPAAAPEAREAAQEPHRRRADQRSGRSAHTDGAVLQAAAPRSDHGLHHAGTRREHPPCGLPQRARPRCPGAGAAHRRGLERRDGGDLAGRDRRRGIRPQGPAARHDRGGVERGRQHRRHGFGHRSGHPRGRHAPHPGGARRRAAQPPARPARAAPERLRLPAAGVAGAHHLSPRHGRGTTLGYPSGSVHRLRVASDGMMHKAKLALVLACIWVPLSGDPLAAAAGVRARVQPRGRVADGPRRPP